MELQFILALLLAALLLTGGLISYVGRRDRGVDSPSGLASAPSSELHRRRADPDRPAPGPESEPPTAPSPTDPRTRPQPQDPPGIPPAAAAAPLGPEQPEAEDEGVLAARQALAANQAAMSDPGLSTLDRVQTLMSSPAFALHLQDQGLERPSGPPGDDKRDPRNKREPLEPS